MPDVVMGLLAVSRDCFPIELSRKRRAMVAEECARRKISLVEMTRFYRHVLLEKRFPHHTAVAFAHAGRTLVEAMRLLGVKDISWNRPRSVPYPDELPF